VAPKARTCSYVQQDSSCLWAVDQKCVILSGGNSNLIVSEHTFCIKSVTEIYVSCSWPITWFIAVYWLSCDVGLGCIQVSSLVEGVFVSVEIYPDEAQSESAPAG